MLFNSTYQNILPALSIRLGLDLSKLFLALLHRTFLVPDVGHAVLLDGLSGPLGEVRESVEAVGDRRRNHPVLCKSIKTNEEGCNNGFGKGQLGAASEERRSILEQWFDLLLNDANELFRELLLLFAGLLQRDLEPVAAGFGVPRVHEEIDAGALQGIIHRISWREKMRWVGVGQELRHNGRLGDDLSIEIDGRDEAALRDRISEG